MINKKLSYLFVVLFMSIAAYMPFTGSALCEIIYLKDGSVLKGSIIREGMSDITIKNESGETTVKLSDTQRILYGNNEMEQVFIITVTGNIEKGYMVDQDEEKIIIREDPYSPQEKTILKKDIRQISRDELYPLDFEVYVKPAWFMPLDSGGSDLAGSLYYSFGMGFNSIVAMNLRLMLEAGYTSPESKSNSARHLRIIPVTLSFAYRIGTANFGFIPKLGAGVAMMEFDTGEGEVRSSKVMELLAGAGIVYGVTRQVSAGLWAEYAVFIDSDYLQGASFGFSCSYRM